VWPINPVAPVIKISAIHPNLTINVPKNNNKAGFGIIN
jgi:hypothetical protein